MANRGGVGAILARVQAPVLLVLLAVGSGFLLARDFSHPHASRAPRSSPAEIRTAFGHLPLSFEPNQGQSDGRVRFLARGSSYSLFLTPREAVLRLTGARDAQDQTAHALEMQLAGANQNPDMSGSERLPGHSNYFIGSDPSRWRRNIPQFARVRYRQVYPGIDLAFYGNQGRLEYDFDVAPGADPRQIKLDFKGAKDVTIAANGDLVLNAGGRDLRFQAPRVYQKRVSGTQPVSGSFVLRGKDSVGFEVGDYDRSRSLVIDPVLVFSTYLGGSGDESCTAIASAPLGFVPHCPAIVVDSASRVYVAGATTSSNSFPVPSGTPPTLNGGADVFLVRFDSTGTALEYTTYLGGSGMEYPAGVAVDGAFNVYVAGTTSSSDFPTTVGAFQSGALTSGKHVFVSKLDSSGSAHLYSTFLSGTGVDTAASLAVDTLGRAYVMGITTSSDFPVTSGALQPTSLAANQFFFSKVDPAASGTSSLLYSTYIGGSTPSNGTVSGGAVTVDSNFNVYLAGGTNFSNMPVLNAFQSALNQTVPGTSDVWAARLNAPANNTQQYTPLYETYFGGSGDDIAYGIAADTSTAYITGSTTSSGLLSPSGATAFQTCLNQPPPNATPPCGTGTATDAFIAKFGLPTTTGTTSGSVPLSFFSYLGGSAADAGLAIVVDSTQNARVTGWTKSTDFPNSSALPGSSGGGTDGFVARIVTTGTSTTNTSSTSILGGSGTDIGTSIALDPALNVYVAGETSSGNFPKANALQATLAGPTDAFVTKLGPNTSGLSFVCSGTSCPGSNPTVSPTPVGIGSQVTFTYLIYNTGDPVSGVVFTDTMVNSTYVSATANQGLACQNSGATVACNLGTVGTSQVSSTGALTPFTVTVTVCASGGLTCANTAASTPGVLPPVPPPVSNSATLAVLGTGFQTASPTATATVNDFAVSASPQTQTVIAGVPATYSVQVSPTGAGFPESVSLSCGSGLPSGAACTFTNIPIPNMSNGPQSRSLQITTIPRVTTTGSRFLPGGPTYAIWLPIFGGGLMGAGISRKRRLLLGCFLAIVLGSALLQIGCGSKSSTTTTTTGTPAGNYTVTVNATSGAIRTTTVQLTVQ